MRIDTADGTITLPSGARLGPELSQDAFLADTAFTGAKSRHYNTLPWIHYHFEGGVIEENALIVSICFYDQTLVSVDLSLDLYPPGPRPLDWSSYSLDVEAATKDRHDVLLTELLGRPAERGHLSMGKLSRQQRTLSRPLTWTFPWGTVYSGHDAKGGGTSIVVRYGDRHREANAAYRQGRGTTPP